MTERARGRTGRIVGYCKAESAQADIGDCLRKLMLNVDGGEKIQALVKYPIAGKVTCADTSLMWAFIKRTRRSSSSMETMRGRSGSRSRKHKKNVGEREGYQESSKGSSTT